MKKLQNFAEFRRKLPISRNAAHFAKRRNWVGHYTNDFQIFFCHFRANDTHTAMQKLKWILQMKQYTSRTTERLKWRTWRHLTASLSSNCWRCKLQVVRQVTLSSVMVTSKHIDTVCGNNERVETRFVWSRERQSTRAVVDNPTSKAFNTAVEKTGTVPSITAGCRSGLVRAFVCVATVLQLALAVCFLLLPHEK